MDVNANSKLKRKKKTHGLVSWAICWLVFRVGVRIVRWKGLIVRLEPGWTWGDVCVLCSHLKFDRGFGKVCYLCLNQESTQKTWVVPCLNLVFQTVFSGQGTRRSDIAIDLTPSWITSQGCCRSQRKSSRNWIRFPFLDWQWAIWEPRVSFKVINVLHLLLVSICLLVYLYSYFFPRLQTMRCWLLP